MVLGAKVELDRLNRDTTTVTKGLYSSKTGTKVDATLDTRLLTEEGREQIKKEYEEMNKNMNIISGTLPDANSDNLIESTVGEVWNTLTKYLTLGIVPSNENNGGILAQIPVLTGVNDSQHKVLQVVNEQSDKYKQNKEDYIKMEDSSYYKSLLNEDKKLFDGQNLYVSKEPIIVTKDSATYQNSINGMMNSIGEAIINGLQQTGQIDIKNNSEVELNVNYNPSYGFLGDLLESFVDKSGIGTTGIAKQTGGFVHDTTTARRETGSNFAMHSQGNAIVYNGIIYMQTTTGFQPVAYYDTGGKINGESIYNVPSFVSFGSPMSGEDMETVIKNIGYEYSGAYTKSGDFVGETIGGNKGNDQQADILDRLNILNIGKLFTNDSPHGTYSCEDFGDNVKCGYRP